MQGVVAVSVVVAVVCTVLLVLEQGEVVAVLREPCPDLDPVLHCHLVISLVISKAKLSSRFLAIAKLYC